MTHWSCTKKRIKQGHFETIQKEMKHGKKTHYFYRCFVSCSNCNVQVSPALSSVVPASCLERLSSASSTARAWQLLPWDLGGWGSKNLAADGSICTSNPPGKNLPPSSLLKLKTEDKTLLRPIWKSDWKARRKRLHVVLSYRELFWALGWHGQRKKPHLGEENYCLFVSPCNPYLLPLNVVSAHTTPTSHVAPWVGGCKHSFHCCLSIFIGTFDLYKTLFLLHWL